MSWNVYGNVYGPGSGGTGGGGTGLGSDFIQRKIRRGDDHTETWTAETANQWPDLTGATLKLVARNRRGITIELTPTVVQPTGLQQFTAAFTKEDHTNRPAGSYTYDVQATLSDGTVETLVDSPTDTIELVETYTDRPTYTPSP